MKASAASNSNSSRCGIIIINRLQRQQPRGLFGRGPAGFVRESPAPAEPSVPTRVVVWCAALHLHRYCTACAAHAHGADAVRPVVIPYNAVAVPAMHEVVYRSRSLLQSSNTTSDDSTGYYSDKWTAIALAITCGSICIIFLFFIGCQQYLQRRLRMKVALGKRLYC